MKSIRRLCAILLVFAMLLTNSGMAALAVAVLNFPPSTKTISAESFYGNQSIDTVVLPEGIREIEDNAFANSSLSEIFLPDTLNWISPNAFDGPEKVHITANEGSYAYEWAVANGYITENSPWNDTPIAITSAGNTTAKNGTLIPESQYGKFLTLDGSKGWFILQAPSRGYYSFEVLNSSTNYDASIWTYKDNESSTARVDVLNYTKNSSSHVLQNTSEFDAGQNVYFWIARNNNGNYRYTEKLKTIIWFTNTENSYWDVIADLSASFINRKILLTWNADEIADGYRVYEIIDGTKKLITTLGATTNYELGSASQGTHIYAVQPFKTINGQKTYGYLETTSITIDPLYADSISLNKSYLSMQAGETAILSVTILPNDVENQAVTWSSDDVGVATVNGMGKVTAVSGGIATITATTNDGSNLSATCVVEVSVIKPQLTVTHPDIGNVLNAGTIEMFNGEAYQTWTINSNYPCRVEKVGDWFTLDNTSFDAGTSKLILRMTDGAPMGTVRNGKVKFYIEDSLYVTVNIKQDGGAIKEPTISPTISVSHPILGDIFNAGTFEMWNGAAYQTWTVTSNCDWSISTSGAWFTVDKTSGTSGTSTIKLTIADGVSAGEVRTGSVTFEVNGKTYKTVNFRQIGPEKALTITHTLLGDIFNASPIEMHNNSAVQNWTIVSNAAWTIKTSGTWFTVDKTSGSANTDSNPSTNLKITINSGVTAGNTRNGSISFYFGSTLYRTVNFYQDGGESEPDTAPAESISITHPLIGNVIAASPIMMFNNSATQTWTVNANYNWTIATSSDSWFSVSPTSGSAGVTTNVTITINSYAASLRSGTITFKMGNKAKETITIKQGSDVSYSDSFSISHPDLGNVLEQDTIYMHNGPGVQNWTVMSNVDWSLTQTGDWFSITPTSGSANTSNNQSTNVKLTFTSGVSAGQTRTGSVKFSYYINGRKQTSTIDIAQYGGPIGNTTTIVNDPSLAVSHKLLGDVFEASPIEMHNNSAEQNWTVTSNKAWTIKTTGSWFTVSPTSGSANTDSNPTTNVKISMSSGTATGTKREGTITFYLNGTKYRTINIYQNGITASMTLGSADFGDILTMDKVSLENSKKTYSWTMKANSAWSVVKTGSWFSVSPTSGSKDTLYTMEITVSQLPAKGGALTGALTFSLDGKSYKTIPLEISNLDNVVITPEDIKLPAPQNLQATMQTSTKALLTWSSVAGASGYNIWRSTSAVSGYTKLNTSLVKSPYTDSTLTVGVNYYYYVEAVSSTDVRGSASEPVGPVSFNMNCALSLNAKAWTPSAAGDSKSFTVTKHGSNAYRVSIEQYNSEGTLCTNDVTDNNHKLANWLNASVGTSSTSATSFSLTAGKNYAANGKTAVVTLTCACGATHSIVINQASNESAPASVSMSLSGFNAFTETSTQKNTVVQSHTNYRLVAGDTIAVEVKAGNNARRVTFRVKDFSGVTINEQSRTTTGSTGITNTFSYVLPENAVSGVYTIEVYAANSIISGDDGQYIDVKSSIAVGKVEESANIFTKYLFTYPNGTKRWVATDAEAKKLSIRTSDNIIKLKIDFDNGTNKVYEGINSYTIVGTYHVFNVEAPAPSNGYRHYDVYGYTASKTDTPSVSEPYYFYAATTAGDKQGTDVKTTLQGVKLLNNPGSTDSVLSTIALGSTVHIQGQVGNYYYVEHNGITGVIPKSAVDAKEPIMLNEGKLKSYYIMGKDTISVEWTTYGMQTPNQLTYYVIFENVETGQTITEISSGSSSYNVKVSGSFPIGTYTVFVKAKDVNGFTFASNNSQRTFDVIDLDEELRTVKFNYEELMRFHKVFDGGYTYNGESIFIDIESFTQDKVAKAYSEKLGCNVNGVEAQTLRATYIAESLMKQVSKGKKNVLPFSEFSDFLDAAGLGKNAYNGLLKIMNLNATTDGTIPLAKITPDVYEQWFKDNVELDLGMISYFSDITDVINALYDVVDKYCLFTNYDQAKLNRIIDGLLQSDDTVLRMVAGLLESWKTKEGVIRYICASYGFKAADILFQEIYKDIKSFTAPYIAAIPVVGPFIEGVSIGKDIGVSINNALLNIDSIQEAAYKAEYAVKLAKAYRSKYEEIYNEFINDPMNRAKYNKLVKATATFSELVALEYEAFAGIPKAQDESIWRKICNFLTQSGGYSQTIEQCKTCAAYARNNMSYALQSFDQYCLGKYVK